MSNEAKKDTTPSANKPAETKDAKPEAKTEKKTDNNAAKSLLFVVISIIIIILLVAIALLINRGINPGTNTNNPVSGATSETNNSNNTNNSNTNNTDNSGDTNSNDNSNTDNNGSDSSDNTDNSSDENTDGNDNENNNDNNSDDQSNEGDSNEDDSNGSVLNGASTSSNAGVLPSGHTQEGFNRSASTQTEINNSGNWVPTVYLAGDIPTNNKKYTVQLGDTLWWIAQGHYGDAFQWVRIKDANASQIGFLPNGQHALIWPQQILDIP